MELTIKASLLISIGDGSAFGGKDEDYDSFSIIIVLIHFQYPKHTVLS